MSRNTLVLIALAAVLISAIMAGCTSSSPTVKTGDNVTIDYVINSSDGTMLQTSYAQLAKDLGVYNRTLDYAPQHFQVGDTGVDGVIDGVNEAVIGMKVNETKTVVIPPEKAFGEYNRSWIIPFNLSEITAAGITPHVNQTLQTPYYVQKGRVDSIDADNNTIYLDFNRAHAGETFVYQITVRSIG